MSRKTEKVVKGKKKSKEKNLKPDRKTTEKANCYNEIKKALKRINLKRTIIDATDK